MSVTFLEDLTDECIKNIEEEIFEYLKTFILFGHIEHPRFATNNREYLAEVIHLLDGVIVLNNHHVVFNDKDMPDCNRVLMKKQKMKMFCRRVLFNSV